MSSHPSPDNEVQFSSGWLSALLFLLSCLGFLVGLYLVVTWEWLAPTIIGLLLLASSLFYFWFTLHYLGEKQVIPAWMAAYGGAFLGLFSYGLLIYLLRFLNNDLSYREEFANLPDNESVVHVIVIRVVLGAVESLDYFGWSYCIAAVVIGATVGLLIRRRFKIDFGPRLEELKIPKKRGW